MLKKINLNLMLTCNIYNYINLNFNQLIFPFLRQEESSTGDSKLLYLHLLAKFSWVIIGFLVIIFIAENSTE